MQEYLHDTSTGGVGSAECCRRRGGASLLPSFNPEGRSGRATQRQSIGFTPRFVMGMASMALLLSFSTAWVTLHSSGPVFLPTCSRFGLRTSPVTGVCLGRRGLQVPVQRPRIIGSTNVLVHLRASGVVAEEDYEDEWEQDEYEDEVVKVKSPGWVTCIHPRCSGEPCRFCIHTCIIHGHTRTFP